jgi:hypothetical protein
MDHLRRDPVVSEVTDMKSEELGPGVFRFKAEVAWDGEAVAGRYLARCGRDALVARLAAAMEADKAAAAAAAAAVVGTAGTSPPLGEQGSNSGGDGGDERRSLLVDGYAASEVARGRNGVGQPGAVAPPHRHSAVDLVLQRYGRDIINAVGAEVDRIEGEIQVGAGVMFATTDCERTLQNTVFLCTTPCEAAGISLRSLSGREKTLLFTR